MKQRARRDEDKAERIGAILKAGRELWSEKPDFSMIDVAARAGIVKGTIYLYFRSREELLSAIGECLIGDCFDEIDRELEKRKGRWTAEQIANLFARTFHDCGSELLARFATGEGARRHTRTAQLLESRVPALKRGNAMRFLLRVQALLIGLADPKDFRAAITALLRGMEKKS